MQDFVCTANMQISVCSCECWTINDVQSKAASPNNSFHQIGLCRALNIFYNPGLLNHLHYRLW